MFNLENKVTTIKGEKVSRKDCRRIGGEYYKVGDPLVKGSGDCYQINGRYYRDDTGYIVFDELKNEYVINNESMVHGIVGIEKGEFVLGYFSKNPLYNIDLVTKEGTTHTVVNESIMKDCRAYRYHVTNDAYYPRDYNPAVQFIRKPDVSMDEKYRLPYNCDSVLSGFQASYEKADIVIDKAVEDTSRLLGDLTFGLEFETISGKVPSRLTSSLGLIPLRDGSISGLEYATIPYGGAKGIAATKLACEALERYTEYDDNCSLHLHIGGMPRTKEFLLALFKVLALIQDEMYSLFPIYKKYNFGVKRKNYTKPLPIVELLNSMDNVVTSSNIDKNFDVLFRFLSMGIGMDNYGSNDLGDVTHHPSDPGGRSKWNIRSRYHWVNLIPIVFGNKKTVEFRMHTPTTDTNKVLSYLFICGGIINYVKDNTDQILQGNAYKTLNDIVYEAYKGNSFMITRLQSYISNRRKTTYNQNSEGNIRGNESEIRSINIIKEDRSSRGTGETLDEALRRTSSMFINPPNMGIYDATTI